MTARNGPCGFFKGMRGRRINMESDGSEGQSAGHEKSTNYNIHKKIFVGNVGYRIGTKKLSRFFSKFGEVEFCYLPKDHIKKWPKGFAFVTFKTEESMKRALEAPEEKLSLGGRTLRIHAAELSKKTKLLQDSTELSDDDEEETDGGSGSKPHDTGVEETTSSGTSLPGGEQTSVTDTEDASLNSVFDVNSLLDDLLIEIILLLPVNQRILIERVCKRWRYLAQKSWKRQRTLQLQKMSRGFQGMTDHGLVALLSRCGKYLHCLDLSTSPRLLTDFALDIIAKHCPHLRKLDLSCVKVTDISLRNLVFQCSKLQDVSLKLCHDVTDQGISNLLKGAPDLECLDLTHIRAITGKGFQGVGDKTKKLVLKHCNMLKNSSMEILTKRCKRLEYLDIDCCCGLTFVSVTRICQSFTNLKTLHYQRHGPSVDSEALTSLGRLSNLEWLDVSNGSHVNDEVLTAVADGCSKLRYLDISCCYLVTDVGMAMLKLCEHLETLDVSYLNKVRGETFVDIAAGGHLIKLVARATKYTTDENVVAIAMLSPNLQHLDLSGCFQITNKIFEGFNTIPVNERHTIELYLGGTLVDWIGQDIDWLSGFSHLQVFMHNLANERLRRDGNIIIAVDDSSDEEEPQLPAGVLPPEAVGGFEDDWEEEDDGQEGYDGFLDNDDPLEAERWDMS